MADLGPTYSRNSEPLEEKEGRVEGGEKLNVIHTDTTLTGSDEVTGTHFGPDSSCSPRIRPSCDETPSSRDYTRPEMEKRNF